VLDGMPCVLPTAQAISAVGKRVKSAVEQDELLAEGRGAETGAAILVVVIVVWCSGQICRGWRF
jgi:hypothetical protein